MGVRCDGRWAGHPRAPRRWVAVSLVLRYIELEGGLGDWRTMIVNDAECQRWEVQPGNHSISDHTTGLYI